MDKTYISKGQTVKLANFIEQICERNHLYNYAGAVSIALENLLNFVDQDIMLSFSHCKDGICFSVATESGFFLTSPFLEATDKENDSVFIVKTLADAINISSDGKNMDLIFNVNGVEEELTIDRRQKIKSYSSKNLAVAN